MPELEWIRAALADRRLSVVSERTGISEPTLRAIRDGQGNPTVKTLNKVATYLIGQGE